MDQFVNRLGEDLEQGDVVVIGENQSALAYGVNNQIPIPEVDLAQAAYDTRVCGIVHEIQGKLEPASTGEGQAAAQQPAVSQQPGRKARGKKPAALAGPVQARQLTVEESAQHEAGRVGSDEVGWMVTLGAYGFCKVDADIAPVAVGDLLTTSPTRGHAQKVLDRAQATGAIIAKALGSLESGRGKIPVIVLHQ